MRAIQTVEFPKGLAVTNEKPATKSPKDTGEESGISSLGVGFGPARWKQEHAVMETGHSIGMKTRESLLHIR